MPAFPKGTANANCLQKPYLGKRLLLQKFKFLILNPPLLLLHGALGAQEQLFPLRELLQPDYTVHTLNFSGHGGRPFGSQFGTMAFVNEVLAYLDEHDLSQVDIFGYSMGGYVALCLARLYPDRVRRIFTLATKFDWTAETAKREVTMLDPAVIEQKVPHFAQTLQKRHAPNDWKELLACTAEMMLDLGDRNLLPPAILATIPHPVIIARGKDDRMVTYEESLHTAQALPAGRLLPIPDTPHPIEKVDMDTLAEFLRVFLS